MAGPEAKIEKTVTEYAESKGCIARKFVSPGHKGANDHIYFPVGKPAFLIEFKAPGKRPNTLQARFITKLVARGHKVLACDNIEQGKRFVDENT